MDLALKELAKLEQLTDPSSSKKGKTPSIDQSLDTLLNTLRTARDKVANGTASPITLVGLPKSIDTCRKEVEERHKEVYNVLSRMGKALDKKFPTPLPEYDPLFTSSDAVAALERTVALHYLRTGHFDVARTLVQEAAVDVRKEESQFHDLFKILTALRNGDIGPALSWAEVNRDFLNARNSPLEFRLHRSQYLRILLSSSSTDAAITYGRAHFAGKYTEYTVEIDRLWGCLIYLPRLTTSPYADLAGPDVHTALEPLFASEWCARAGMSRQVPLQVVGDIGGGGALARIEKGKKVIKERKGGWSQTDELPIEIPLPPENRYHSIFACPVSKEQATEKNPPMMMSCSHVITKESLEKLTRPNGRVKCPYCPVESQNTEAIKVYF